MSDEAQGNNGLTRREVLRVLGAATGLAYLGSVAGCGSLWQRQPVIKVDSWHKGGCRFCGTGCGMMIGVTGGKVVDVKGDEEAHNRGRLCIKGLMNKEILYTQDRALYPMIRKNGELVRATWDEAMTVVADRFPTQSQSMVPIVSPTTAADSSILRKPIPPTNCSRPGSARTTSTATPGFAWPPPSPAIPPVSEKMSHQA